MGGEAEQLGYEQSLARRIVCRQPSHSSFPNHVDSFNVANGK
jgi:hypothetical protein